MYRFDPTISSTVEDGSAPPVQEGPVEGPLSAELRDKMQRYWQAANYLTVGQIYLQDNPLLREPLRPSTSSRASWGTGALRRA